MSAVYDELNEALIGFIRRQKLFFVATAPLSAEGSVNVSPKGYDSLAILDSRTVAYLDLGGSGIETHAHVRENGRITLMFCAFEGPANIVRIYGQGETCSFDEPGFAEKMTLFPAFERARGVITTRNMPLLILLRTASVKNRQFMSVHFCNKSFYLEYFNHIGIIQSANEVDLNG